MHPFWKRSGESSTEAREPHPVGHQSQPEEEAVSQDVAATDAVQTATPQNAGTPELVAAANEGAVVRDDAATAALRDVLDAYARHPVIQEIIMAWLEADESDQDRVVVREILTELTSRHRRGEAALHALAGAASPAAAAGHGGVHQFPATQGGRRFDGGKERQHPVGEGDVDQFVAAAAEDDTDQFLAVAAEAVGNKLLAVDAAVTDNPSATPAGSAAQRFTAIPLVAARQEVLAADDSPVVFPGAEDDAHDNGWYDSVIHDAHMQEKMEEPELYGLSSEQQLAPPPEPPMAAHHPTVAGEDRPEISPQDNITNAWGVHPSELDPDEPGPSTKSLTRVPPLADDDVAKFNCGICLETLPVFDLFHGMECDHEFCVQCMASYIEARVTAGAVPIPCPDTACKGDGDAGVLHPEQCKKSIDFAAFSSWGDRLTEHAVPPSRRVYCPNRDCGVMLETTGAKTPSMARCPACSHLMCATCGSDWSTGGGGQHDCAGVVEAALVKRLAAERHWKQCPGCKILVERTEGCSTMRCRCECIFCYNCGRPMVPRPEEGGDRCQCFNIYGFIQ
ncbi:hypothetical protein ACP70R_006352 [Stipagrostis hirtigluma subsp. patula]